MKPLQWTIDSIVGSTFDVTHQLTYRDPSQPTIDGTHPDLQGYRMDLQGRTERRPDAPLLLHLSTETIAEQDKVNGCVYGALVIGVEGTFRRVGDVAFTRGLAPGFIPFDLRITSPDDTQVDFLLTGFWNHETSVTS